MQYEVFHHDHSSSAPFLHVVKRHRDGLGFVCTITFISSLSCLCTFWHAIPTSFDGEFRTVGNFPQYGNSGVNSAVSTIAKSFSELMNFPSSFVPKASPFLPSFSIHNNTQKKSREKRRRPGSIHHTSECTRFT